jgi:hypothetical protein
VNIGAAARDWLVRARCWYTDPLDRANSHLRRTYLPTEQATRFPAPMHLCDLAAEYL